tara:strand:+ start:408 stop:563 length:156 start_codon:yes stop_codon:yes gene_type:complete
MTIVIAKNSAFIKINKIAELKKVKIKNNTEWTALFEKITNTLEEMTKKEKK